MLAQPIFLLQNFVIVFSLPHGLIYLLLLINAIFAWSTVHQQEETTNDREDLEEVVLGKILVRVMVMQLEISLV
jgi:hypothetical protein